jgi:hypothetical protein
MIWLIILIIIINIFDILILKGSQFFSSSIFLLHNYSLLINANNGFIPGPSYYNVSLSLPYHIDSIMKIVKINLAYIKILNNIVII